jgi:c-di-GMP-related signal transduction protein
MSSVLSLIFQRIPPMSEARANMLKAVFGDESTAPPANVPLPTPTRFVGRQPILDVRQEVFGYELLFRSGWENYFSGDSDTASRQMIDNMLLLGVEALALGRKAFVNCTREALIGRLVTCLPVASTVLEILETVVLDEEVINACIDLKQCGYQIALDDFVPCLGSDKLIEIVDYVKLDFRACDAEQLRQIQLQLAGTGTSLLAEKVETEEEFARACSDGYDYFQGYFFSRPSILPNYEIPANRLNYIRLLSALSRSPSDRREIERMVMAETSLCYRVLRLVNSAGFGMRGEVCSIREALLCIGDDNFRRLASVAAATALGKDANRSTELMFLTLHRARFCELLGPVVRQPADEQYLIGLLSTVDAILQIPMQDLVKLLPLRPPAVRVLLGGDGPLATSLRLQQHYERSEWEFCAEFCREYSVSEAELTEIYLAALRWATHEIREAGM